MTTHQLPVIVYKGKKYYRDTKLRQIRNVDNPHDFIDFDDMEGEGLLLSAERGSPMETVDMESPAPIESSGTEADYKAVFTCSKCGFSYTMESMITKEEAEEYKARQERVLNLIRCPKCGGFDTGRIWIKRMEPEGEDLCDIAVRAALSVLHDKCGAAGCARKNLKIGGSTVVVEYPSAEVEVIVKSSTLAAPDKVRILREMGWLTEFSTNYVCETLKMCGQKVDPEDQKAAIDSVADAVARQLVEVG